MPNESGSLQMLGASSGPCPVDKTTSLAIDPARAAAVADALRVQDIPAVILATCHRLEVYWWGEPRRSASVRLALHLCAGVRADLPMESRQGDDALQHLMAVASGLRSLRRGEPEILGQVRAAWRAAQLSGSSNRALDEQLRVAIAASRHIRRHIGEDADASIGSATVQLLTRELARGTIAPTAPRLLLLGAGAVGESVAMAFAEATRRGALPSGTTLVIANRTTDRAERLAAHIDGAVIAWDAWCDALPVADVVIASARSATPLITRAHAEMVAAQRTARALWIDLASPPNIAADALHAQLQRRTLADLATGHETDAPEDPAVQALQSEIARFQSDRRRRYDNLVGATRGEWRLSG